MNSCQNLLAPRAEKGAAPGLDQAGDGGTAASAGLALLAVDQQVELEEPGFSLAVKVVVHRGAALADGRPEDAPGFLEDAAPVVGGEAPCRGGWMDTGGEQDFAGVDVPEPGQYSGVQEEGLDGPGAAPGLGPQPLGSHSPGEGFPPHLLQGRRGRPRREDQHLAEAPDVLVDEIKPPFQVKAEMDVGQVRHRLFFRTQEQVTGHAQMHQQGGAVLQAKDQVFAPAEESHQSAAHQPAFKFPGRRLPSQGLFAHGNPEETAAHQMRGQTLPDNLYFGKLGHLSFEFRVSSFEFPEYILK